MSMVFDILSGLAFGIAFLGMFASWDAELCARWYTVSALFGIAGGVA